MDKDGLNPVAKVSPVGKDAKLLFSTRPFVFITAVKCPIKHLSLHQGSLRLFCVGAPYLN